jgi:hypothetical protein
MVRVVLPIWELPLVFRSVPVLGRVEGVDEGPVFELVGVFKHPESVSINVLKMGRKRFMESLQFSGERISETLEVLGVLV